MRRTALSWAAFFAAALVPLVSQAKLRSGTKALSSCASFTSNEEIADRLVEIEGILGPDAKRFEVGRSVEDRPIWGLELGCAARGDAGCPAARVIGGLHGNECLSVEMVLALMERLVESARRGETNDRSALVEDATLVFVPLVNPDGHGGPAAFRENARGIDINRNFGFAWISEGPEPFSEPETRALRALSDRYRFQIGLSYHTVERYINAPWNHTPHHPPEAALIEEMAAAYRGDSTYETTFGWDWYEIYGDLDDWSLGVWGTLNWTIEMRSDRDMELEVHAQGFDALMAYLFRGVRGRVIDPRTGRGISARIEVDDDSAPVFTGSSGDFFKILRPGAFSLDVHAPGYVSQTLEVEIEPGDSSSLEVALEPEISPHPDCAFQIEQMTLAEEIPRGLGTADYPNDTLAWFALGTPDDVGYALTPGGSLTVDFGPDKVIADRPGDDLEVRSATHSADPYAVFVSRDRDGPYLPLGEHSGTFRFDLEEAGVDFVRYVRIVDRGNSAWTEEAPGFDLDAVINLSPAEAPHLPRGGGCGCAAGRREVGLLNLVAVLLSTA